MLRDTIDLRCKIGSLRCVHQYVSYGDKEFSQLIAEHDIVISAVDNYLFIDKMFNSCRAAGKIAISMDCSNFQIRLHSNIASSPQSKNLKHAASYIHSKAYTGQRVLALEGIKFPTSGVHCVYWAVELLQEIFTANYDFIQGFLASPLEYLQKLETSERVATFSTLQSLELINCLYSKAYPMNFAEIARVAANYLVVSSSQTGILRPADRKPEQRAP